MADELPQSVADRIGELEAEKARYVAEASEHEEGLRQLQQELDMRDRAMEASNEGIVVLDIRAPDNPIVYVNGGFERQTGYTRDEVLHQSARFIHGPQTDPGTLAKIRNAIETGQPCTDEVLSYRKDGSAFWNRISLSPIHNRVGEITHFVSIQSDVSARTQSNAEVESALELLEKTNVHLTRINRRMKKNLEAAAQVQHALLPEHMPEMEGIDFAWKFRPCDELAGDILNVFRINRKTVGLYLLDVTGHGTAAALMAVSVSRMLSPKALSSSLVREEDSSAADYKVVAPSRVAEQLNDHFPWDAETGQFFTLIYGVLDAEALTFRYVSAGHPGPAVFAVGEEPHIPQSGGLPIGLSNEPYEEQCIQLAPGDRLHLYSDGVTEVMNKQRELYGVPRLLDSLRCNCECPLSECQVRLMSDLEQFRGSARFNDDISLLSLEVRVEK
jgi:phosphoserine phosphatase RsbU/P